MKTSGKLPSVKVFTILLLLILSQSTAFAQPEYSFKNPSLVSGSALQTGSIYLFQNVKPGVDARIQVRSFVGGVTLDRIDEGWTGFDDAFQPFVNVGGKASGYVEFEIRFYIAGTTTLMNQAYVPMTPIDVDGATYGDGVMYETDQIELKNGYYSFSTSTNEIIVSKAPGWVRGRNSTGWSYPGIDTAAKPVMFSVVNGGVNAIKVRIGAENSSTSSEVRFRSIYFKNFSYNSGILTSNSITDFSGSALAGNVNLKYILTETEKVKTVTVEKAGSDMNFKTMSEVPVQASKTVYETSDVQTAGTSFYRLRVLHANGQVVYSNMLRFESKQTGLTGLKVFPSVVQDKVTVQLQNNAADMATLQIYDYNGRMVHTQQVKTQTGMQNLTINGLDHLSHGNYVVVARIGNELLQQKILKQ
jgi:hypothetical protein